MNVRMSGDINLAKLFLKFNMLFGAFCCILSTNLWLSSLHFREQFLSAPPGGGGHGRLLRPQPLPSPREYATAANANFYMFVLKSSFSTFLSVLNILYGVL